MRSRSGRVLAAATLTASAAVLGLAVPANAAHVSCGDVITQDTKLDSDLVGCTGDALVIAADGVTLHLGGHTISGAAGSLAGVRAAGRDDVEIRDGTIRGFTQGVVLDQTTSSKVSRLTLEDNVRGIDLAGADGNMVDRNTITGSALDAIRLGLSSGNFVTRNEVNGNVFSISVADGSTANRINRNEVTGNREGIALFGGGGDNLVDRNLSSGNVVDGIRIEADVANTQLVRNETHDNGDDGIDVNASSGVLTRNVATGNGDLGFEVAPDVTDGGRNEASGNVNPAQCTGISC